MAPVLYRAMKESAKRLRAGDDVDAAMAGGAELIANAGFVLDYFEARHAETLAPIASVKDGPMRILVAARLGKTRLIDNIAVVVKQPEIAQFAAHRLGHRRDAGGGGFAEIGRRGIFGRDSASPGTAASAAATPRSPWAASPAGSVRCRPCRGTARSR